MYKKSFGIPASFNVYMSKISFLKICNEYRVQTIYCNVGQSDLPTVAVYAGCPVPELLEHIPLPLPLLQPGPGIPSPCSSQDQVYLPPALDSFTV